MALTLRQKQDTLRRLLRLKQYGHRAEIALLFEGEEQRAADVRASCDAIAREIDRLLGELMTEWEGEASEVRTRLMGVTDDVRASVEDIEDKKSVARSVVRLIGQFDDLVQLVRGLVA